MDKKRIKWNNPNLKSKSKIAFIYIHGFSASLERLDQFLIFWLKIIMQIFLLDYQDMGLMILFLKDVDGVDWYLDVQEAFEIGKKIGDKIIV